MSTVVLTVSIHIPPIFHFFDNKQFKRNFWHECVVSLATYLMECLSTFLKALVMIYFFLEIIVLMLYGSNLKK